MWEITGAEFSKSTKHTADGISIRFPRVTRIRDDKDWETATDLEHLAVCLLPFSFFHSFLLAVFLSSKPSFLPSIFFLFSFFSHKFVHFPSLVILTFSSVSSSFLFIIRLIDLSHFLVSLCCRRCSKTPADLQVSIVPIVIVISTKMMD